MVPDPKPTHLLTMTLAQSSIMNTNPHRPNAIFHVLEPEGGVVWVLQPKPIVF
jgi:hypothetical protein